MKEVYNGKKTKERAHIELGLTIRQIDRLVNRYIEKGKYGFIHGNRGRQPVTTISKDLKDTIIDLFYTKYSDCTYTLFAELLAQRENINIATDTLRKLLLDNDILSPKSHRKTRKRIKARINKKIQDTSSKRQIRQLQAKLVDAEFAHPTQPRCIFFREEIQIDACIHNWFGKGKSAFHTSSVPEFKPRIERLFGTLHNRLNVFLRLHNVTSIDEANSLVPEFIKEYNEKFALPIQDNKNVFVKQLSEEKINLTLAVLSRRTIDSGHSLRFKNKFYKLINSNKGSQIFFAKGTKCVVIEAFDKKLYATIDENIFALEEIPKFMAKSPNFDNIE